MKDRLEQLKAVSNVQEMFFFLLLYDCVYTYDTYFRIGNVKFIWVKWNMQVKHPSVRSMTLLMIDGNKTEA